MDSPRSSSQTSSLDSLRTVEFRQTLRGYHIDDVDEYLEKVAVDAEAIQEQLRQSGERLKQAAERIAHLEELLQEAQHQSVAPGQGVSDDTLQRTLLLAQKFVDQTQFEAESQARVLVSEAEERARKVLGDAEQRAKVVTEDTERHLREEIARLESIRTQLAGDVETIARHMENERNRLRGALGDMLTWVEEHVQPASSILAQRSPSRPSTSPAGDGAGSGAGATPAAGAQTSPGVPSQARLTDTLEGVAPSDPEGSGSGGTSAPVAAPGMAPMTGSPEPRAGVPH